MRIRWRGFELPTRITVDRETLTGEYGKFVAEPFERGYGTTIGNSLRRTLLSSLEGAAVTAIKIDGVSHEFTAIPGVVEDVTDIVLNVKEIRVRVHTDDPQTIFVEKSSKGPVKAGDIKTTENVQIGNPDLVLATLSDNVKFRMELVVRRGRGYVTAEEHSAEDQPIGTINVDSIFSPVRRARFLTENTRVGKMTNYDKMTIEIWTDGTVAPEMALVEASNILRKHLNPFVKYFELGREIEVESEQAEALEEGAAAQARELAQKLSQPISALNPSVRAENCLKAEGISTLRDLVRRTEQEMLKIRNFGKTSLKEMKKKLADLDLSFGMKVPPSMS